MRISGMGERPQRPALAVPLADEILRLRLVERLADRWNVRLVVLEAPGGFGKSVAIAQAIRDNDTDPSGIDAFARCRVGSDALADVVRRLLVDLSRTGTSPAAADLVPAASSPDHLVELVVQQVTQASPVDVSLWFDDVHLHEQVEGLRPFLAGLVDRLPINGHVVLAGRSMPALRLARLRAADDLVEVGPTELGFEPAETEQLAQHHGVDAERLAAGGGWPAVTRLLVVAGVESSTEFVIEEVIDRMAANERLAIAVAIVAGEATPVLLAAVGCDVEVRRLFRTVPLLSDHGDGTFGAHDLWHDVLGRLVHEDRVCEIARLVAAELARSGDHPGATDVALRFGVWREAAGYIMDSFEEFDLNVEAGQVEHWLSVLPPDADQHPASLFLRGVHTRLSGDIRGSTNLVLAAATAFEQAGELERATTAVLELALQAWLLDDADIWTEMFTWSKRIIDAGGVRMANTSAMGRVVAAELRGDFTAALAEYEALGELDEIALGHAATLSLLVGKPTESVRYLEEQLVRFPRESVTAQLRGVRWNMGDPDTVADVGDYASSGFSNPRDHVRAAFIESMIEASLGTVPDADRVTAQAWDRGREQAFAALAHAARDLLVADEATAASAFDARLDEIGWDDELMWGELRRYLPYAFVLSPRCRERFDAETLGPLHDDFRSLARSFVSLRDGAPGAELPAASSIVAWMPISWSVELAAHLAARSDSRSSELIALLSDLGGAATHRELRRLQSGDETVARGADLLLANVPAPPAVPTELHVCAAFELRRGGVDVPVNRQRVRQLLALLAVRPDWTRQTLMSALWPGDEARARSNLRATLTHTRKLLEPDRQSGEASHHLRHRGDRVWLQRDEHLRVDLWELERRLDAGRTAEQRDDLNEAIEHRGAALRLLSPDTLAELADLDVVQESVDHLRHRALAAGAWVAEQMLSQGDLDEVGEIVERLLAVDPHLERAHAVAIGAKLAANDLSGASSAVELARRSLATLGVNATAGTDMLIRRYERRVGRESDAG